MDWRDKRTVLYLLYGVVVILVIVGIILIFQPQHVSAPTAKHATTSHSPAGATASKGASDKIVIKGVTSSGPTTTTPATAATKATTTPLNNTGPGNVIGPAIAVSILGAWFWRRKQLHSRV